jgi:hypothetical protein
MKAIRRTKALQVVVCVFYDRLIHAFGGVVAVVAGLTAAAAFDDLAVIRGTRVDHIVPH